MLVLLIVVVFFMPLAAQETEGIIPEIAYTTEMLSIVFGDSKSRGSLFLDNLDVVLDFETEALGLWKGGTAHIYYLSNIGDNPSELVGDVQVTSNFEADDSQRLYELWYNQAVGNFEVLVGLHDLNSEFYISDVGGLFCNSSFGIGADVAGSVPVSIFNVVGLGARVLYTPNENLNLLAAFYDGDPGDVESNPHGLNLKWDKDEGVMSIFETQVAGGGPEKKEFGNTYRLGAWYHSGPFEISEYDSSGAQLPPSRGNYGVYFSVDQWLGNTMAAFIHGGMAASDRSAIPLYFGTGVSFSPKRLADTFGLAVACAKVQEKNSWEIVLELTWHVLVKEFFTIQPDIQYVIHPNGNNENDVLIAGVRISVGL